MKIAINGFGRIGRMAFRKALSANNVDVVAINDLTTPETLAHLLKYDSVHGQFNGTVSVNSGQMIVNEKPIQIFAERDPANLPWKHLEVDTVLECTGFFRDQTGAGKHITAGARKVIISAPAVDPDNTIVLGVNNETYDKENHHIISNASCTTNCLAPMVKILLSEFGIVHGQMTTIHSYTNDQNVADAPHSDLRRARAAAMSMIPTTTGAAKAVSLVIPEVKGKLDGLAIRVPTANVSLVDLTLTTEKSVTKEGVNAAMKSAAEGSLKGILRYCDEPLVSSDFNGDDHSCIFDSELTTVVDEKSLKVFGWYDNETAYSQRLIDLLKLV